MGNPFNMCLKFVKLLPHLKIPCIPLGDDDHVAGHPLCPLRQGASHLCHCLEGELQVSQGPDMKFVAKTGDVWSCKKGMPEANVNNGSTVAIMRVIDLIPPA